jgi:O-antigen ligase
VTASIQRQPNPLLRGSFPLLLIFLFFIFSGVMEVVPVLPKMRPQLILAVLGLLTVLGTGQFVKVLRTPIGVCNVLFSIWFIACIPFGAWPGGSFGVFTEVWYKSALMYFLTAGLLTTLPQANRLYRTIGYSVGILSLLALVKNDRTGDGRLILDNTRYANSNDLAFTLVLGLTFIGLLYLRGTRFQKVIAVLMVPPVLMTVARTGSRGVALGVVVLAAVMLVQAKRATRTILLVALPIVFVAVLVLMPSDMRMRYTTYFGDYDYYKSFVDPAEKLRAEAIESSKARKQLLIDSLVITMKHPLGGVGPGNFEVAQNDLAKARGDQKGSWHVTHNTYTELSSEMGIVGLGIFLAILYNAFKVLNSIIRTRYPGPNWQNLRQLATSLRAAFIVFVPVAFFGSFGYLFEIPILAGLTTALGFLTQKQRAIDRAANAQIVAAEPLLETGVEPVAVGQY